MNDLRKNWRNGDVEAWRNLELNDFKKIILRFYQVHS